MDSGSSSNNSSSSSATPLGLLDVQGWALVRLPEDETTFAALREALRAAEISIPVSSFEHASQKDAGSQSSELVVRVRHRPSLAELRVEFDLLANSSKSMKKQIALSRELAKELKRRTVPTVEDLAKELKLRRAEEDQEDVVATCEPPELDDVGILE